MPLPEESVIRWQQWKDSLGALDDVRIPRSYSSAAPTTDSRELHVFADASEKVIAAVAYMRTTSLMGDQVSLFRGKAKVAPTHPLTMPRLELCTTLLATEIGELVQSHLNLTFNLTKYYSDSKVVLGYLTSRTKRFYIYVANQVQRILQHTRPDQWMYIPTHLNPADLGTRAIKRISLQIPGG